MKDAQTFWDMYSQYIDDDIDSLQQVAGRNIITKTDFFKAFEEYAAQPDLNKQYNDKYCIGYSMSALELQKEKFKQIFGHSDAYTIEQYVNGFIELVQSNASQSRWVKVSDVEPEIDVPYNIVYSGVVQWVAYKFDGENWVDMHDIAPALPKNDVSHYQPLPTPPKE